MGTGAKPLASTPCSCHYEGSLIDGTVFDSSFKRGQPSTFAPNQVIKARPAPYQHANRSTVDMRVFRRHVYPHAAAGVERVAAGVAC